MHLKTNLLTGSAGSTRVETCAGCVEDLDEADAFMELILQICSLNLSMTPTYEILTLGFIVHLFLDDFTISRTESISVLVYRWPELEPDQFKFSSSFIHKSIHNYTHVLPNLLIFFSHVSFHLLPIYFLITSQQSFSNATVLHFQSQSEFTFSDLPSSSFRTGKIYSGWPPLQLGPG